MQIKRLTHFSKTSKILKPIQKEFKKDLGCESIKLFKNKKGTLAVLGYNEHNRLTHSLVINPDKSQLHKTYRNSFILNIIPEKTRKEITSLFVSPEGKEVYRTQNTFQYIKKKLISKTEKTEIGDFSILKTTSASEEMKHRVIRKNHVPLFIEGLKY